MEKKPSVNVGAVLLGEFIDDALEGVEPRPLAASSEIVKARLLGEFVDDATACPLPLSQSTTPENEVPIKG